MTAPRRLDLAEMVAELTGPHTHVEHYTVRVDGAWVGRDHTVRVPSLLQQLWANDTPSATVEEGPRPGFASKPAARLDALDTAVRIDVEAARWLRDLGEDDPTDTVACLRRLHALAVSADPVTQRAIEADVRSWWVRARIVTGWDSPAWIPDNTCPSCGERGTLRVRLSDQIGTCTNDACRVTWAAPETIGLLADHIRGESLEERAPARDRGACWCPLPRPALEDLGYLCPRCGSASCTWALQRRLVEGLKSGRITA
jgi:hypothetical protein